MNCRRYYCHTFRRLFFVLYFCFDSGTGEMNGKDSRNENQRMQSTNGDDAGGVEKGCDVAGEKFGRGRGVMIKIVLLTIDIKAGMLKVAEVRR